MMLAGVFLAICMKDSEWEGLTIGEEWSLIE
jgi:hypothetical protein